MDSTVRHTLQEMRTMKTARRCKIEEFLNSDSIDKDKKRELVYYRDKQQMTRLHQACSRKLGPDIIKSLLDLGGKELVMLTTSQKWTALHIACYHGESCDVMKTLIDVGGAELVMAKDEDGSTGLHTLCRYISRQFQVAIRIKFLLEVPGTETILTEKNNNGETPLDIVNLRTASNKIKALLHPRTINDEAAMSSDDASDSVQDDQFNNTATTELQDQLHEGTKQKIADMETLIEIQKTQLETQTTEHRRTIADLETDIVLLSKKNAKQDKDNKYWKDRVDNLTQLCSERKVELQQLKDSSHVSNISNVKRERDGEDDGGDQDQYDEATHLREESVPNVKRDRDEVYDGDLSQDHDQNDESSHSQASKRSRIGSTAHDMDAVEDDAETLMEELLREKEQHVHEKQKNIKLMKQLSETRKMLGLRKSKA